MKTIFILIYFQFISLIVIGQGSFMLDMSKISMNYENKFELLDYNIINNSQQSERIFIEGFVRFTGSQDYIKYKHELTVPFGSFNVNNIKNLISIQYSNSNLRALYLNNNMLPLGRIQYCVEVYKLNFSGEGQQKVPLADECLVINNHNSFLIELFDPEDNALISSYNPNLSWIVNSHLNGSLEYRLMVAPINKGQSKLDAIKRNRFIYEEKNLSTTNQTYPQFAKPLVANQKYAWNVEAYYHGYLIGTSRPWSFQIVIDSIKDSTIHSISYLDIMSDNDFGEVMVPGILKLKYNLKDSYTDSLKFTLLDQNLKEVKLKIPNIKQMMYGDNRFAIDFYEYQPLKHNKKYTLIISSLHKANRRIVFTYKNPDLL